MTARWIAVVASLVFLAAGARELIRRGGPVRAKTFVSHSGYAGADAEAAVLLVQRARKIIPTTATVRVVDGRERASLGVLTTVAQGQMPAHRVGNDDGADYVVAFRDHFDDARYEVIWSGSEGTILRRRR